MSINTRLTALRNLMRMQKIDAMIVPTGDSHFSEYTANYWKCLKWISGFSGSAGTFVLTKETAALWTDSRYFIQAEKQLNGTEITLMRMKVAGTPTIDEWLKKQLSDNSVVAIDGKLFSKNSFDNLKQLLSPLKLIAIKDLFLPIWEDRPPLPHSPAYLLPLSITGMACKEKVEIICEQLDLKKDDYYVVSALDEIAWLLNMRGADIYCNPLVISYLVVGSSKLILFVDNTKFKQEDLKTLEQEGVIIQAYEEFNSLWRTLPKSSVIHLNYNKTNIDTFESICEANLEVKKEVDAFGIITRLKACKNPVELEGFRQAMIIDGKAKLRFWKWIEENLGKIEITEWSAAQKLQDFRSLSADYIGNSFATISTYGPNAAMPHYSVKKDTSAILQKAGFYLVDSGAQYPFGTTDITRTVYLGDTPTEEEKENYTLVLKGMIALSKAIFPSGTRGTQLDILARGFLWSKGKNFLHGTGHGVGHFLCVHEGPQSIRMEENPISMEVGMVTSNEPAYYLEGKYGIRTENLVACIEATDKNYYCFETLTLCPIDTKAINLKLFTEEEKIWLNEYHQKVYSLLKDGLNEEDLAYLKLKTKAV